MSFFGSSVFSVQGVAVPGAHALITLPKFPKVLVAMQVFCRGHMIGIIKALGVIPPPLHEIPSLIINSGG